MPQREATAPRKEYTTTVINYALCGTLGVIHSFDMTAANIHDLHYLENARWEYHDCMILGDKGYLSASMQQDLFSAVEVPYRLNQENRRPTSRAYRRQKEN